MRVWTVGIVMCAMVAAGCSSDSSGESSAPGTGSAAQQPSGLVWERVPDDGSDLRGPGFQSMWGVTLGGPGLVAVGFAGLPGDFDAATWTSPDGIAWSMVRGDDAVFGGPGRQSMNSVANGNPGLVSVGWTESADGFVAAVWASPDGVAWSRVPHDEATFGGSDDESVLWMSSVASNGQALVAGWGGRGDSSDVRVWISSDGATWVRVPDDEVVFGGEHHQEAWDVAIRDGRIVVVGRDGPGDIDNDAAVWVALSER